MRINTFILIFSLLATGVTLAAKRDKRRESDQPTLPAPSGKSIVAKNSTLELLFTRKAKIEGGLTEGPPSLPMAASISRTFRWEATTG